MSVEAQIEELRAELSASLSARERRVIERELAAAIAALAKLVRLAPG